MPVNLDQASDGAAPLADNHVVTVATVGFWVQCLHQVKFRLPIVAIIFRGTRHFQIAVDPVDFNNTFTVDRSHQCHVTSTLFIPG